MYLKFPRDFDALMPAIQEALDGGDIPKTMIFFNTRDDVHKACRHLRKLVPEQYHD